MIAFTVDGKPATKGSFRAIVTRGRTASGRPKAIAKNDNPRTKSWQAIVGWSARAAMRGAAPMTRGVEVGAMFRFTRPKRIDRAGDYDGPMLDVDKLLRALLDGLSGILFADDAQVERADAGKRWCEPGEAEGVEVVVRERSATPIVDALAAMVDAIPRRKR